MRIAGSRRRSNWRALTFRVVKARATDQSERTPCVPGVRIESGFMEPTEVNANRFAKVAGGQILLDDNA
jgi:hypothetical protein